MQQTNTARSILCAGCCILLWLTAGLAFEAIQVRFFAAAAAAALLVWALLRTAAQALAVLVFAHFVGLTRVRCGLCRPARGGALPAACCVAVAAAFAFWGQTDTSFTLFPTGEDTVALKLAFLQLCIAAPLAEEAVFRGAVQGALQELGGAAVLLQAIAFAWMHGSVAQQIYALTLGAALGWLARRTKSVWPGVALHCLNNILVFVFLLAQNAAS